jgi:hypothetical protein
VEATQMSDPRKTEPSDSLLKTYFQILREMGPDPVLEQRIREQESHVDEPAHAQAS